MWCTRWFAPLLLLPYPVAPVYFIIVCILTLGLHAKPCYYCITIISIAFLTSYYWPPLPLDTPLTVPWTNDDSNITTFNQALHHLLNVSLLHTTNNSALLASSYAAILSNLHDNTTYINLPERGWLSPTNRSIFTPFKIAAWEKRGVENALNSLLKTEVERLKAVREEMERKAKEAGVDLKRTKEMSDVDEHGHIWPQCWEPNLVRKSVMKCLRQWARPLLAPFNRLPATSAVEGGASGNTTQVQENATAASLPWLRREYNLSAYGIGAVFDFGW